MSYNASFFSVGLAVLKKCQYLFKNLLFQIESLKKNSEYALCVCSNVINVMTYSTHECTIFHVIKYEHYVTAKKTIHMYAMYMSPMCCYESIHGLRMHGKDVS